MSASSLVGAAHTYSALPSELNENSFRRFTWGWPLPVAAGEFNISETPGNPGSHEQRKPDVGVSSDGNAGGACRRKR